MTSNSPATADNPDSDMARARAAFLAARKRKADERKAARQAAQTPSRVTSVTTVTYETAPGQSAGSNSPSEPVLNPSAMPETPDKQTPDSQKRVTRMNRPGYGKAPIEPNPNGGHPVVWTEEIAAIWQTRIIEWLQGGQSLMSFCRLHQDGPARHTVLRWRSEYPMFGSEYARAREDGADALADGVIDISDEVADAGPQDSARVNAARLRVDARKWSASKLKPGAYADRLETVHSGNMDVTHKLSDDDRAMALASILARREIQQSASLPDALRRIADRQAQPVTLDAMTGEQIDSDKPASD